MPKPVNILTFGGCLLHGPLAGLMRDGTRITHARYGPIAACYTLGFMLQTIAMLRGERDVPQEIRRLCGISPKAGPVDRANTFADVDMVVLEPNSPLEITFRDCIVNRLIFYKQIIAPIRELSPALSRAAMQWFRGVDSLNAEIRDQAGRATLDLLPADYPNRAFIEAALLETQVARTDIPGALRALRDTIGRPIGVLIYVFQYLADGRAVSWPAGFQEDIRDAASRLDLPILEPADYVNAYPAGVAAALKPDLRHYSPAFNALMGDVLVEFCQNVRDGLPYPGPAALAAAPARREAVGA